MTGAVAGTALAIAAVPELQELLRWERAGSGPWTWAGAHLVHASGSHLLWDLAVFAVLGAWLERRGRAAMVAATAASSLAVTASVALWTTLSSYVGLSGVDTALFAAVAVELWRTAQSRMERLVPLGFGAALAAKVAYEAITADALFAAQDGTWVPVPLAHAVGGAVGALVWAGLQRPQPQQGGGEAEDPARGGRADERDSGHGGGGRPRPRRGGHEGALVPPHGGRHLVP